MFPQQEFVIPVFVKELVLHKTLAKSQRTDDNRLVDIRVSNPYRADYIDAVGAAHTFESPSKDVSGYALLHRVKGVKDNIPDTVILVQPDRKV